MQLGSFTFAEVIVADFEFAARPGERPRPVCLVAKSLVTGTTYRLWQDELLRCTEPPYPTDDSTLFVAYYASAEVGCHLALNWPVPTNVLDLFTEFRNLTNGLDVPCGNGLLGALAWFGLDSITVAEKDTMRDLALRGGPWTPAEQKALLHVLRKRRGRPCSTPTMPNAFDRLAPCTPSGPIHGRRGPHRSRRHPNRCRSAPQYRRTLGRHQARAHPRIDADYGVYENGTFKRDRFAAFLVAN